jgi:dTDP-4-amino-4,6-dideoxygalactose transaminase
MKRLSTRESRPVTNGQDEAAHQKWTVPLSDVLVDDEIIDAVRQIVSSGWWSMGPTVEAFEEAFAAYVGSRHAIAVSNGTAALHLALLAAGCGPGDEVVLPSLNFVAAANAVAHTGARPVFCDIVGATNLNLDPVDLAAAISPATKAIVPLHYGGFPCDMDAVLDIARRHGLVVIEDAAHAPGATWRGQMCGTLGLAGCFSFFSNKNLPVGEGGMIVTNGDELAARIRLLRSHGMTTLTWTRHQGHASTYDVVARGFNYRLDELHAGIGLVQLRRLERANQARARIAALYRKELGEVSGLAIPFGDDDRDASSAHHLAVLVLPTDGLQAPIRAFLNERGIQTSIHYPPIHRFSEYAEDLGRELPVTDRISGRLLTLPLFAHMRDEQVGLVVENVLAAVDNAYLQGRVKR